jgi:hypothetical protein
MAGTQSQATDTNLAIAEKERSKEKRNLETIISNTQKRVLNEPSDIKSASDPKIKRRPQAAREL